MISLEQARDEVLARATPAPPEEVPLEEAGGRFLSQVITAHEDIPPFDNSAMDGFAIRSVDTRGADPSAPIRLRVTSIVEAGSDPSIDVGPREAARIYTGASVPPGADCIVPFERAAAFDEDWVEVPYPPRLGEHVRRRGSDLRVGDRVLRPGQRLTPAAIGVAATLGYARIRVGRRPRVAIHSSGNELIPVEETLRPGKIRNSNAYSLAARITEWGAVALRRPVLLDTPEAVREGLRETLFLGPDVVVTTGGISAGDLDFIREVARELGDRIEVRKVAMKPGKPLVYGLLGGVPFFGLPGNPAACLVSFEMFVRPALAKIEGRTDALPRRVQARVQSDLMLSSTARVQMLRGFAHFSATEAEYAVEVFAGQGSHLLSTFAESNCFVQVPAGQDSLKTGQCVDVLLFDGV